MIKADTKEIADLARSLQKTARDVPAAFEQVAQRVAKQTGPVAVDEITAIYGLSEKRAQSAISTRAQGPVIFTVAKSRGVTLKEFGGEKYAKGYRAQIKRGKFRNVRGGFTAKAKFTGDLPFKRVGKSRYPIKVLYGPKVSSMIRNREVAPRFAVRQAGIARTELTRQMLGKLDRM